MNAIVKFQMDDQHQLGKFYPLLWSLSYNHANCKRKRMICTKLPVSVPMLYEGISKVNDTSETLFVGARETHALI